MNSCSCCCCFGSCQPVNTSGPAIDAADCVTTGTSDTINGLVAAGVGALNTIFGQKSQQQATAVKAQVQLQQSKNSMVMWIAIALIAVVGFGFFARVK